MRFARLLPFASLLLVACGGSTTSYIKSDAALGRVIVYRNGVAYFEREATVEDDHLRLIAPNDKVDDFLKSLTVVDSTTGKPAPISYPHESGQFVDLKVQLAGGKGTHKVKLSYVTAAPAWKPSYRVLVGADGKLELQAWAVVDNTSGEDWTNVKLGVGSSSAMSFLFDLRGFRFVERQQIHSEELFAYAPPTGGSTYGGAGSGYEFSDDALGAAVAGMDADERELAYTETAPAPVSATKSRPSGGAGRAPAAAAAAAEPAYGQKADRAKRAADKSNTNVQQNTALQSQVSQLANQLRYNQNTVVIEGYAAPGDGNKDQASLERANRVRDQLLANGVPPNRVVTIAKGIQPGKNGGVKIVQNAPNAGKQEAPKKPKDGAPVGEPIGTSHFESGQAMTVPKASSAMVSVFDGKTEGGVVYLYDPESERGDSQFAFKAVRFKNPTDSQLESGPMTVYGDTRFIGEGIAEPIPARSLAFVPFANDHMVLVEKKGDEHDQISKIVTAQRGILNVEAKHYRQSHLILNNRGDQKLTVYVRHTPAAGFTMEGDFAKAERYGAAYLMPVEIAPRSKAEIDLKESTPITRSIDIRSPQGVDMVRAYISSDLATGALKESVAAILKQQMEISNIEQRIVTAREQMAEYRTRMDELHGQIFSLKLVKSGGPMMANLEKKMSEMGNKVTALTIQVADLQEQSMIGRIKLQDLLSDLTIEKPAAEEPKK